MRYAREPDLYRSSRCSLFDDVFRARVWVLITNVANRSKFPHTPSIASTLISSRHHDRSRHISTNVPPSVSGCTLMISEGGRRVGLDRNRIRCLLPIPRSMEPRLQQHLPEFAKSTRRGTVWVQPRHAQKSSPDIQRLGHSRPNHLSLAAACGLLKPGPAPYGFCIPRCASF